MVTTADELSQEVAAQRSQVGVTLNTIGDRVSPGRIYTRRKTAIRHRARSIRESVMGAGDDASESMRETMRSTQQRAEEFRGSTRDRAADVAQHVSDAPQAVTSKAQGNPIAAGIISFGIGALLGSILPESEMEQQVTGQLQPTIDNFKQEVTDVARSTVDDLKEPAQDAMSDVADTAKQAVEQVRSQTTTSAEAVKEQATQSKDRVKADMTAS